ncbi:MAG: TlpA family protein disulfide reductase [Phycisphaerae bacterium]|nr:TlpA family protein disulfide reductase [Phycisphaerae bacterium]
MKVSGEPQCSVKRVRQGSIPSFSVLCFALIVGVLFVAAPTPAGMPYGKIDLVLIVHDADSHSVPKFEAMIHTHHEGYIRWQSGREGRIHFGATDVQTLRLRNDPQFQVIVRAPGLAPAILNLESTGAHMERTVSLTPGRLIELSVRKVDGRAIPKDVVPSVVYSEFADRVRPMRMPENIRPGRVIDFEMSKVHRVGEGRFRFRVPGETPPFFLAIDHPGFMRTIETEMISESELADGRIEWQLPASARLRVRFDFPAAGDHPRYDCSSVLVATHIPDVAKYYTVWLQKQSDNLSFDATLDDLPPNDYKLLLWLVPPEHEGVSRPGDATRLFRDSVEFSLIAGEEKTIDLDYAAYDPDSWRGSTTATVTVKNYDGKPAAGSSYMLTYAVPHYYGVVIEGGYLDAAGRFQLEGVRPGPDGPVFYLKVGDERLRRMQMTEKGSQNFEFTLAPRVGDRAPDVTLVGAKTSRPLSLRSLQGKVIYLEFWATWCGPCKTPMAKLNRATKKRRGDWGDRVEVLAVSIDDSKDVVYSYAKRRGWTHVRHFWTGASGRRAFESPAAEKFGVNGVPTAILIDPQGAIIWRGHPKDHNCETQIDELL